MSWALFRDRAEAGSKLAAKIGPKNFQRPLVLALPRGGVVVGYWVAKTMQAPLDVIIVRKIGVPGQPELALGAIVDGEQPETVLNADVVAMAGVDQAWIKKESKLKLVEIERRHKLYRAGRGQVEIAGHTAILVDDGIATGATVRAALKAVRRAKPLKLVLAVPVAPPDTIADLQAEVDEVICLATPEPFFAIGNFYQDFSQTTDEEVVKLLAQRAKEHAKAG
jgi:putative phosphoribosyl transferase